MGMLSEHACSHCKGTGYEKIFEKPVEKLENNISVSQEEVLKAMQEDMDKKDYELAVEILAENNKKIPLEEVEKKLSKSKAKPKSKGK